MAFIDIRKKNSEQNDRIKDKVKRAGQTRPAT